MKVATATVNKKDPPATVPITIPCTECEDARPPHIPLLKKRGERINNNNNTRNSYKENQILHCSCIWEAFHTLLSVLNF